MKWKMKRIKETAILHGKAVLKGKMIIKGAVYYENQ